MEDRKRPKLPNCVSSVLDLDTRLQMHLVVEVPPVNGQFSICSVLASLCTVPGSVFTCAWLASPIRSVRSQIMVTPTSSQGRFLLPEKLVQRPGEVRASSRLFYSISVQDSRPFDVESLPGFQLRFCARESGILFDCSGLLARRSRVCRSPVLHSFVLRSRSMALLLLVVISLLAASLWAQEETTGNPTTGTIQGTLLDEDGNAVEGAKVLYSSPDTETRGETRSGKGGKYVSETVPPGPYIVRVEGRNFRPVESRVTVALGAAVKADFKLEWIPRRTARLENKFSGEVADTLPLNGRNYLSAAQLEPGVQVVDVVIFDPGKSGFQSLSIDSLLGRTTHYDIDEVEAMDETKGAATLNLPAESVSEVIVSRVTAEVFQALNAAGAVRVTTHSAGEEWHGNLLGNLRDQVVGLAGFPSGNSDYSRQQYRITIS